MKPTETVRLEHGRDFFSVIIDRPPISDAITRYNVDATIDTR